MPSTAAGPERPAPLSDSAFVERYLAQPARLPDSTRAAFEAAAQGEPVLLYALSDLDAGLRVREQWIAVTPSWLVIGTPAEPGADGGAPPQRVVPRTEIQAVRERPGLSACELLVLAAPDEPALAVIRYSQRQRRTFDAIRYLLETPAAQPAVADADAADRAYAEAVARPVRAAQAAFSTRRLAVVWRLLGYLRPYRMRVAGGMAAAAGMTLLSLAPPFLTGTLIDTVFRPHAAGTLERAPALSTAWWLLAAIASAYFFREFFAWIRLRTMAVLGEAVARDLRTELYEHLQRLSLSYYSSKQTGSIITRVSSDTDRLWDFIAFGVVEVTLSLLMLTGLSIVLVSLDPLLGLMLLMPLPLWLWAIAYHGGIMNRLFLRAWRKWSRVTEVLSDTIPGVRVVRAFHQERREQRRFGRANYDAVDCFNEIHGTWTRFWPLLMLSVQAVMLSVWAVAIPRLLADGDGGGWFAPLSLGTFVSFLLYMTMFVQPVEVIGQMSRMTNRATSSAVRVFEVLDTQPGPSVADDGEQPGELRGDIAFENVTFAYDGARKVIDNVSFRVRAGEMIGLVGPSGSGKTTLTNLLVRFYEATGGRIMIDGHDLARLDLGSFRRQVGMVLQDPFLFHGTVLENIRYGMPDASLTEIVGAARTANAHEFILRLPHAYDTVIGERGHTLSGGERQRISIARAVLCNPRILILDEATSSVDTETEKKIQEALDRLVAGRTVIAIAHRLSTLTRADRLIVIEKGRIAEQGTHAELLARPDGLYRRLHTMQQQLHEAYAV